MKKSYFCIIKKIKMSKYLNRIFIFILLLFIITVSVKGQTTKYSNEFLAIGVGARAMGMSNAVVSNVDDVTSGYWNPSGLVNIKFNRQASLMHAEYFAGIAKYDYGSIAAKIDSNSAAALSVIRFAVDDIPNTTELIDNDGNINYDKITSFSAVDFAMLFSYARKSPIDGLNFGANAKIIRRKVGSFAQAWGFGFDIGAQYKIDKWMVGAVIKDATTTYNAWSYSFDDRTKEILALTGNEVPQSSKEITLPKLIIGGARSFTFFQKFSVLPALDIDITTDRKRNVLIRTNPFSIDPHLGLELDYNKIIFLRAGIGNIQNETIETGKKIKSFQLNMGLGVNINNVLSIDYALTDIGNNSIALYSNIFSLRLNINRKEN